MSAHGQNYLSTQTSDFWVSSSFLSFLWPYFLHPSPSSLLSISRDVLLYHDVRGSFLTLQTAPRAKSPPSAKWGACLWRLPPTQPSFAPYLQPHVLLLGHGWAWPPASPHCQPWTQGVQDLSSFFRLISSTLLPPGTPLPAHSLTTWSTPLPPGSLLWLLQPIHSSHSPVNVLIGESLRLYAPLRVGSWMAHWGWGG